MSMHLPSLAKCAQKMKPISKNRSQSLWLPPPKKDHWGPAGSPAGFYVKMSHFAKNTTFTALGPNISRNLPTKLSLRREVPRYPGAPHAKFWFNLVNIWQFAEQNTF